jgi:oxygen-independent coproporphyrinogen-3 oxidase
MDAYVDALIKEIKYYRKEIRSSSTLYLGGGTPSLLSVKQFERFMAAIDVPMIQEFTVEVNPESVTRELLESFKVQGVNRISMGVQTTDDQRLKFLGRLHNFDMVKQKVGLIREMGFNNLNLDLIYGLPGQTIEDVEKDVHGILSMNPEHISTYSLTYDEGTPLERMLRLGEVEQVSDDLDRDMFQRIVELVGQEGYDRYEISNFAKNGYASKHNLLYWNAEHYVGLGVAAHGYLGSERYANVSSIDTYIERLQSDQSPIEKIELIDEDEAIFEYIILNLRKRSGIDLKSFTECFGVDFERRYEDVLPELLEHHLMAIEGRHYHLTDYGMDVSNAVFRKFR